MISGRHSRGRPPGLARGGAAADERGALAVLNSAPIAAQDSTANGRRRLLRPALIGANIVVAVSLLASGSALAYVDYRSSQIHRVALPGLVHRGHDSGGVTLAPTKAMTILLVGSNSRSALDGKQAGAFGTPAEVGGARSDVTMLLRLDPVNGPRVLSIPRDLFVPMPPGVAVGSVGKIDAALNSGPEKLIEAITNDLGIPIDHYVEVNFDGFQNVINALGGIDMFFPVPLRDSYSALNITKPGCQHLNGFEALAVVRSRRLEYSSSGRWVSDPLSDLSRIRRDHEFLSVFAKTMQDRGFSDPFRANAVLGNLVGQVTVDQGLDLATMLHLIERYSTIDPRMVPQVTLPVTTVNNYSYRGSNYGDVVFPSFPEDAQVIGSFIGGYLRPFASTPSVQVVDRSGIGMGSAIARGLKSQGFNITSSGYGSALSQPSETVIKYHVGRPGQAADVGEVNAALPIVAALKGAVVMFGDAGVAPGSLVVEVGSVIALNSPAPAPGAAGATGTPTPGNYPVSQALTPLQSFDPTACPK